MKDQTGKPNVLLVCADQWNGLLTRPAAHPVVMTPTLGQMGQCARVRSGPKYTKNCLGFQRVRWDDGGDG